MYRLCPSGSSLRTPQSYGVPQSQAPCCSNSVAPPAAQVLLRPPRQGPRPGGVAPRRGRSRPGGGGSRISPGRPGGPEPPERRERPAGGAGGKGGEGEEACPSHPLFFLSFLSFSVSRCINAILCVPLQEYPLTNASMSSSRRSARLPHLLRDFFAAEARAGAGALRIEHG